MKIGFIGVGNMGSAVVKGIVSKGIIDSKNIFLSNRTFKKAEDLANLIGGNALRDNSEVVKNSDIIFIGVKPVYMKEVISEIKEVFDSSKLLVSLAVGVPISFFKYILGEDAKVIRTMPNTPALVGEGMTLISYEENVPSEDVDEVKKLLQSCGLVEILDEKLMNEVTALTGSSPAYVFMFIEAMADAAVQSGIPRSIAYKLAAQAVLGSAKMVVETGKHPAELKDQVCSPAGTTMEAVYSLEKSGFRGIVMNAMDSCTNRAREISKNFK